MFCGAAKKAWDACLKGLKGCGCFGACWKVVEEVPLVKERKKKREGRRGKMVDRHGTGGDGDGIELTDMGGKGKSNDEPIDSGEGKSGGQTGESSGSQGANGLRNDKQAVQGEQDVMMSGALNDGESGIEMTNMVNKGKDKEDEVDGGGVRSGEQLGESSGSQGGREQGDGEQGVQEARCDDEWNTQRWRECWSASGDGVRP